MSENPHPRKRQEAQAETAPAGRDDWLGRLSRLNVQFGRFLRDAVGVALIAFALMSLLAVWELTDGILLSPFSILLRRWFGWGSLLVIFGIGYCRVNMARRDGRHERCGGVIVFDHDYLLTIGLLAV